MKVNVTLLVVALILAVILFWFIRCAWPFIVIVILAYFIYKLMEER